MSHSSLHCQDTKLFPGVVRALFMMGDELTKLGVFGSKKSSAAEVGVGGTDEEASAFVLPPERQELMRLRGTQSCKLHSEHLIFRRTLWVT